MLDVEMYVFSQNWLKLEDYVGKSWGEGKLITLKIHRHRVLFGKRGRHLFTTFCDPVLCELVIRI